MTLKPIHLLPLLLLLTPTTLSFQPFLTPPQRNSPSERTQPDQSRRNILLTTLLPPALLFTSPLPSSAQTAIETPDFVQQYSDFIKNPEGWSYKDVKQGSPNDKIEDGDRVVFDWSGYTIGYFGRPFEAKGGPQGGAFDKDLDFRRTVVGSGSVVKGLECALRSMGTGGIRQVIVPFGELSYPMDDLVHERVGPKPSTFSGQRALNFVLENTRVDRTLLFNVKVIRVDKKDGKGGFIRGDK